MSRGLLALLGTVVIVSVASPASAQSAGTVGISMRSPSTIGLQWHISDDVALRPEIGLSKVSSTTTSGSAETTTDSWAVTVGGSAIFYVAKWNGVRAYVSPQYHYMRGHASSTGAAGEQTSTSHSVAGSFGTQYSVGDRFAVFGEFGLQYYWQPKWSTSATTTARSNGLDSKTAVGVVFYF